MQHFMTYEFIYEFMYMKNILKVEIIPEIMCNKVPDETVK